MTKSRKPKMFIGSSREAIPIARAVAEWLENTIIVNPWFAGVFGPNDYTMEALDRELDANDFGVFIFAAEDISNIRNKLYFVTRDNTLFEMGMFWGRLGRRRVFCLIPATVPDNGDGGPDSFHLPSDLEGMTLLRYTDNPRISSAVSTACGKILEAVQREGLFRQRQEIITENNAVMERKNSVLQFLWEYLRNVTVQDTQQRYNAYAEAVRNSILPPQGFKTTGAAIWKRHDDGRIAQVGGNVGRGGVYSITANDGQPPENHIIVVSVHNSGRWKFYTRREIAELHVLCYPLGKGHVLSVHFSGNRSLTDSELKQIVEVNDDLLVTIYSLVGGDTK